MKSFLFLFLLGTVARAQFSTKKAIIEGSGSPVVLLAGGRWDMQSFSQPADSLSRKYQVIRMEHFNVQYANEELTLPFGYSVNKESEAVGKTLDSLNIINPIVLIGWSYGALIAMDFALNHPERVQRLGLYEPPAFWIVKEKGEFPEGMDRMIKLIQSFTPDATITDAQLAQFKCILDSCDTTAIRNHSQWATWVNQKGRLRGLSSVANHIDSSSRLHSFRQPVLILTGKGTVAFHRRINQLLEAEFPNATSKEISGGHSAPQAAMGEFIQVLKDFITTN